MDEKLKSKAIRKTDDGGMALIKDILQGQNTRGFDIDSVYCIDDTYFIIELLFCESFPVEKSHPKNYWDKNKTKFISLFELTTKLEGRFILINYEKEHKVFKVMECVSCDMTEIKTKNDVVLDRNEFMSWFQSLNAHKYIELSSIIIAQQQQKSLSTLKKNK